VGSFKEGDLKMTKFYYQDNNAPKPDSIMEGAATIIRCGAEYLFEKRADSDRWSLVGGGLKQDETPIEGAIREIKEETGIVVLPSELELIETIDDPSRIVEYEDGNIVQLKTSLYYTELATKPDITISDESDAMVWVTKGEMKSISIAATHKHIVEEYILDKELE
jgi:8-oxo-dGTP pyrophosphatase MutT (NUDIX family)